MFSGYMQITPTGLRKTSATRNGIQIGTLGITRDGRGFRWTKDDGTGLARARLAVNSNKDTDDDNNLVSVAAAVGDKQVSVAVDGAVTADKYAGGYFTVRDSAGEGYSYLIASNTSVAGAGAIVVNLDEPLIEALTTASEATLRKHAYLDVQLSVADQLDMPVGVTPVAVTASYYFWSQVWGECSVLGDASTHARGSEATISAATAGAVGLKDGIAEPLVGVYNEVLVSAEHESIYLKIG